MSSRQYFCNNIAGYTNEIEARFRILRAESLAIGIEMLQDCTEVVHLCVEQRIKGTAEIYCYRQSCWQNFKKLQCISMSSLTTVLVDGEFVPFL